VARGTQHRKRRPRTDARTAAAVAAPAKAQRRQKPPQWQDELFFSRLRNHAKWIYVGLAIAFAATFALLGVGSGTGVGNALQNFFSSTSTSGPNISKLQTKANANPSNAADWRALATALEQKQRTADAITALQRYSALKPKDTDALTELAAQYTQQATNLQTQVTDAQQAATAANPSATFEPPTTTPLGQVFQSATGLESPITNVVSSQSTASASSLYQQYSQVLSEREGAYKSVAKLKPTDATAQISLGQAALDAQDTTTAITAFKTFLKLAPTDPEAAYARSALKQLQPAKKK
jgi:tetratricopeptide (TPR) repeat protein